ncbi:Lsr2 family DNA-binding protein [Microbacterium sp. LMI1-1-1.1]|uniref:Lsr2 family DNA-binding protein n=1 Tax=Microbacterium sp. LMI1-1-1.1 TaxID=3135223 RepID=UPI003467B68F
MPSRLKSDIDLGAVREWARANGHTVSDRGRLPSTIVEAPKGQQPQRPAPVSSGLREGFVPLRADPSSFPSFRRILLFATQPKSVPVAPISQGGLASSRVSARAAATCSRGRFLRDRSPTAPLRRSIETGPARVLADVRASEYHRLR